MLKIPLDGPTVCSVAEFVAGLLFGALYVRERLRGKPAPPHLQWRWEIILKVLSSRQFWFACLATGLLGTCWIGPMLDASGNCRKTDMWNWECHADWTSPTDKNTELNP